MNPETQFRIEEIITRGDKDNRPFYSINQNGIFEKEVNEKLLRYEADFAVHSLKDLHAGISEKLVISSIPKRESPNDVFINTSNELRINQLEPGSVIGTSSIRRAIQIKTKFPSVKVKSLRGNIETRIKKSIEGQYTGLILAEAGIKRLNLVQRITQRLNIISFTPSPGQGALAIVCRKDDPDTIKILKKIEHKPSTKEIRAERSLIESIGAGCTVPMGALAILNNKSNTLSLFATIYSLDGERSLKIKQKGSADYPEKLGKRSAETLIERGAKEITKEWISNININSNIIGGLIE